MKSLGSKALRTLRQELERRDNAFVAMPYLERMVFIILRLRRNSRARGKAQLEKQRRIAKAAVELDVMIAAAADGVSPRSAEAHAWISRARLQRLSARHRRAILRWLEADPENGRALVRAELIWQAVAARTTA